LKNLFHRHRGGGDNEWTVERFEPMDRLELVQAL
jgi:hypothetical protein